MCVQDGLQCGPRNFNNKIYNTQETQQVQQIEVCIHLYSGLLNGNVPRFYSSQRLSTREHFSKFIYIPIQQ